MPAEQGDSCDVKSYLMDRCQAARVTVTSSVRRPAVCFLRSARAAAAALSAASFAFAASSRRLRVAVACSLLDARTQQAVSLCTILARISCMMQLSPRQLNAGISAKAAGA